MLVKSHSDEVYLVLAKYYYKNEQFDCDRVLAPVNQYVRCWHLERRIDVDKHVLCDVMVLLARHNDMFYVVKPDAKTLYVVRENGVFVKDARVNTQLRGFVAGMEDIQKSGQAEYLRVDKLTYEHWRDVLT